MPDSPVSHRCAAQEYLKKWSYFSNMDLLKLVNVDCLFVADYYLSLYCCPQLPLFSFVFSRRCEVHL